MRILAIVSGQYGLRHVDNLRSRAPAGWTIKMWRGPTLLPMIVDYPEDHVPLTLPPADLLLYLAEYNGIAELLPEVARVTSAQAVIAAIDSEAWLPRGLARQMKGWLADMGVVCVTPKPLCSLTETHYSLGRGQHIPYDDRLIANFARHFGRPELSLTIDPDSRLITDAVVERDTVCGCARYVAQQLAGISVDHAEQKAGLLHHHYPCLASMGIDPDYGDTLMHVSGNIIKNNVGEQVKPFKLVQYLKPNCPTG